MYPARCASGPDPPTRNARYERFRALSHHARLYLVGTSNAVERNSPKSQSIGAIQMTGVTYAGKSVQVCEPQLTDRKNKRTRSFHERRKLDNLITFA